jgi:uncharacterized protein YbjT (DUF2867 family)
MELYDSSLCNGLPTQPKTHMGLVLVTGATGYIGGRLIPELLARKYKVRAMVRALSDELSGRWPDVEIVVSDASDIESLNNALKGVDVAYYLIHSLRLGYKVFEKRDLEIASNFSIAAENQGLKRIIYLSGLGRTDVKLSPHLKNRMKVAEALQKGSTPVTVMRAAMIIGSGSASFEILYNLVLNTRVFILPRWAYTKGQAVGIRDVIKYLIGVLELDETSGKRYDIGGNEILSYAEMLKILSQILGKKRYFLPSFIQSTVIYGYIASLLTPVPAPITKVLIEGCKNEVICQNNNIKMLIPFEPLSFEDSIKRAILFEMQDNIVTRWSDAYPPESKARQRLANLSQPPRYICDYDILSGKTAHAISNSYSNIGGKMGWFHNNWMWRMRGAVDKLLLGVGLSRGRRSYHDLRINDVIDFWRVEDIKPNQLLLLRAEMKLPGEAWLKFQVTKANELHKLTVVAYFQPGGIYTGTCLCLSTL